MKEIYLAGGCFWGVEEYFKNIKGVCETSVGYANGNTETTTYKELKLTNHAEVVYVKYDESVIGLNFLLDMYYKIIDPLSLNKQGEDEGAQYRTGIYYVSESDITLIKESINKLEKLLGKTCVIESLPLSNFVTAEDYHQNYLQNNPTGYCHLRKVDFDYAKSVEPTVD